MTDGSQPGSMRHTIDGTSSSLSYQWRGPNMKPLTTNVVEIIDTSASAPMPSWIGSVVPMPMISGWMTNMKGSTKHGMASQQQMTDVRQKLPPEILAATSAASAVGGVMAERLA